MKLSTVPNGSSVGPGSVPGPFDVVYISVYLYLVIPTAQATKHRKCMEQSFAQGAYMSHGKFLTTNHKQYDMTMIEVKMQVGFDKAVLGL